MNVHLIFVHLKFGYDSLIFQEKSFSPKNGLSKPKARLFEVIEKFGH